MIIDNINKTKNHPNNINKIQFDSKILKYKQWNKDI